MAVGGVVPVKGEGAEDCVVHVREGSRLTRDVGGDGVGSGSMRVEGIEGCVYFCIQVRW